MELTVAHRKKLKEQLLLPNKHKTVLKIGITGGIGSGKTTVCRVFETLGIPVFYADLAAKHLMQHDPELKKHFNMPSGKTYMKTAY